MVISTVKHAFQAGREFSDFSEAGDAMPIGVRLPLALGILPRPLGGE